MASFQETNFRQDMPPEGGYGKIHVQRTFPKIDPKIGRKFAIAIVVGWFAGYYKYRARKMAHFRWNIELNDCRLVQETFLNAERDRLWLNYLHRLRNEERELMKDVPGWRVGTFYGEPIYFTMDPEQWWDPSDREVYAHTSYFEQKRQHNWRGDSDPRAGPKWYDKYLPEFMQKW